MSKKLAIAALCVVAPLSALNAQDTRSGNHWLGKCTGENQIGCVSYLLGVLDYNTWLDANNLKAAFCPPRGFTVGQMQDIVVKALRDNPSTRHEPFILLATDVLRAAFPCARR